MKTSAKTEPLGKAGTILNAQSKVGRQLQYVTIGQHSLQVKIRLNVQFFSRYHSQIISLIVSSALCMPNVKPWHGHMEIRQRVHSGDSHSAKFIFVVSPEFEVESGVCKIVFDSRE